MLDQPRKDAPKEDAALAGLSSFDAIAIGDMVAKMLRTGLPVRWVASPEAAAADLTEMPEAGRG